MHHELGELVLVQVAVLVLVRLGDLPLDPRPELARLVLQAPGRVRLQGVQDVLQGLLVQSSVLVAVLGGQMSYIREAFNKFAEGCGFGGAAKMFANCV